VAQGVGLELKLHTAKKKKTKQTKDQTKIPALMDL
jgi:hypothetical protein